MAQKQDMMTALERLKVLSHPVRLSILCNLMERGEMTAGEIVEQEKGSAGQSQVSQYLKSLRDKGIVTYRKDGLYMHYRISCPKVQRLIETLHDLYCPH